MELQLNVIVWIVIIAFALIIIVTFLASMKVIHIEPSLMKKLEVAVMLEIATAGFFLFYRAFDKAEIQVDTAGNYVFDRSGNPKQFEIAQGDSAIVFDRLPPDGFRNVERNFILRGDTLYLTTRSRDVTLGYLDRVRDKLGDRLLVPEAALGLGILTGFTNKERPSNLQLSHNKTEAANHFLYVLREGDATDVRLMENAMIGLHYLLDYITKPADFRLLETRLLGRTPVHTRYFELAQTHTKHGDLLKRDDETAAKLQYKTALKHYLLYLNLRVSTNSLLNDQTGRALTHARELLDGLGKDIELGLHNEISSAIGNRELHERYRNRLADYAERLFQQTAK